MARRIETGLAVADGIPRAGRVAAAGSATTQSTDDFLSRLVKYIPAEIVGLYLAAAGFVPNEGLPTTSDLSVAVAPMPGEALWYVAGACWVLTALYLGWATKDPQKGSLWSQVILGTVAFPVWVFAIGGPFLRLPWYWDHAYVASLVLVFVTFAMGMVKPPPGS